MIKVLVDTPYGTIEKEFEDEQEAIEYMNSLTTTTTPTPTTPGTYRHPYLGRTRGSRDR